MIGSMIMQEGWKKFADNVKEGTMPVICFGAGTIPWLMEPLFTQLSIWPRILYFLDNDEKKAGTLIGEKRKIPVISVEDFRTKKVKEFIMLITCENFIPVLKQLQKVEEWRDIHCYVYIRINYELLKQAKSTLKRIPGRLPQIPRTIHYCWFGRKQKPELVKLCIQSWIKICPDYKVIEWNEDNYDIHQNRYILEAYANRKWAYVSDYARLDILYQHGGIYLDTDVELLDRLDMLLGEKGFIAYGQWPAVNSGAGMGCVKGLPIVKEMRDQPRKYISFLNPNGSLNMVQNGFYESRALRNYGFLQDFTMQYIEGLLILAPEIMAAESVLGKELLVTENTLAIHHCKGSWKTS